MWIRTRSNYFKALSIVDFSFCCGYFWKNNWKKCYCDIKDLDSHLQHSSFAMHYPCFVFCFHRRPSRCSTCWERSGFLLVNVPGEMTSFSTVFLLEKLKVTTTYMRQIHEIGLKKFFSGIFYRGPLLSIF